MRVPEDKLVLSPHSDDDVIVVTGIGYFAQSHTLTVYGVTSC
jgi:hypothetical protein